MPSYCLGSSLLSDLLLTSSFISSDELFSALLFRLFNKPLLNKNDENTIQRKGKKRRVAMKDLVKIMRK